MLSCQFQHAFILNCSTLISGLPLYALGGIGGYFAGTWMYQTRLYHQKIRNAETKIYIESFPERFPELKNGNTF